MCAYSKDTSRGFSAGVYLCSVNPCRAGPCPKLPLAWVCCLPEAGLEGPCEHELDCKHRLQFQGDKPEKAQAQPGSSTGEVSAVKEMLHNVSSHLRGNAEQSSHLRIYFKLFIAGVRHCSLAADRKCVCNSPRYHAQNMLLKGLLLKKFC